MSWTTSRTSTSPPCCIQRVTTLSCEYTPKKKNPTLDNTHTHLKWNQKSTLGQKKEAWCDGNVMDRTTRVLARGGYG